MFNGSPATNTIPAVTRGGTRSIAVLAATALVVLLLAACGSSDSGSSNSNSAGSTESSATTETNAQNGGSHGENDAGGGQQERAGTPKGSPTFAAKEVETPLKVSGGGSEQFRVKGGDNSIQEYGEEKDEGELQEAAEAVHGFFVARAEGDWAAACSYLSKAMKEQLEQLAASSTGLKNKGCAAFLEAFTSRLPASEWKEITTVDAGSLRQKDEQAFLIYYGPHKAIYAMPLIDEDGEFKVGALAGNALG
jgi:hypothetical protein